MIGLIIEFWRLFQTGVRFWDTGDIFPFMLIYRGMPFDYEIFIDVYMSKKEGRLFWINSRGLMVIICKNVSLYFVTLL